MKFGGERGIRTPGPASKTTDFESAPFDHSGISPLLSALTIFDGRKSNIL
jgi:hypothetical protein